MLKKMFFLVSAILAFGFLDAYADSNNFDGNFHIMVIMPESSYSMMTGKDADYIILSGGKWLTKPNCSGMVCQLAIQLPDQQNSNNETFPLTMGLLNTADGTKSCTVHIGTLVPKLYNGRTNQDKSIQQVDASCGHKSNLKVATVTNNGSYLILQLYYDVKPKKIGPVSKGPFVN